MKTGWQHFLIILLLLQGLLLLLINESEVAGTPNCNGDTS